MYMYLLQAKMDSDLAIWENKHGVSPDQTKHSEGTTPCTSQLIYKCIGQPAHLQNAPKLECKNVSPSREEYLTQPCMCPVGQASQHITHMYMQCLHVLGGFVVLYTGFTFIFTCTCSQGWACRPSVFLCYMWIYFSKLIAVKEKKNFSKPERLRVF